MHRRRAARTPPRRSGACAGGTATSSRATALGCGACSTTAIESSVRGCFPLQTCDWSRSIRAMAADPSQRPRVAVLCGGPAAEREVSLTSGREVANALRETFADVSTHEPDLHLADEL